MASPTEFDPLEMGSTTDGLALVDEFGEYSFADLRKAVESKSLELVGEKDGVALILFEPTMQAIVFYLAALRSGRTIILADRRSKAEVIGNIIDRYGVTLEFGPGDNVTVHGQDGPTPNPATPQILLPTSGSTGSPKMVRLPHSALRANARSIAAELGIGFNDVAPTTLPLHYSYGLSVLNSHLVAGAALALIDHSVITRQFWDDFDRYGCTSFAGVPYTYSMLARMRFSPTDHPSLRTMTQAGGRLSVELREKFHSAMDEVRGQFIVMYGQTEATARMAVLPHAEFSDRRSSAGRALKGGRFSVLADNCETDTANVEGEIVYYGQNVMLGYAEDQADLHATDSCGGRLLTGDTGQLDTEGYLWLSGRKKRIAKVFGERVDLDDVERLAASITEPVAATSGSDHVVIFFEGEDAQLATTLRTHIASELGVHRTGIEVQTLPALPLLNSGKIDYADLARLAQGAAPPSDKEEHES
ncbi:MAG: AMP-binding protein [Acidimicrobiales bacterium]|nr:AMP-binding protein [Acidimicrobiales bacterium]